MQNNFPDINAASLIVPTQDLTDLAIEFWRLEKRLKKIEEKLSEDENKAFRNTIEKLGRFIKKIDLEVTDYTGQFYNEGMNIEILASEKDSQLEKDIIFDTHEPAVAHKGIVIRKAKVIIHEK